MSEQNNPNPQFPNPQNPGYQPQGAPQGYPQQYSAAQQGYPQAGAPMPGAPMPGAMMDPMLEPDGQLTGSTDISEYPAKHIPGIVGFLGFIVFLLVGVFFCIAGAATLDENGSPIPFILGIFLVFVGALLSTSMTIVAPGQTKVLQFFGKYVGTVRETGFFTVVPLTSRKTVSVRVNNFETNDLKVNDANGNPINIAAIIVWKVADTAKSVFTVEDYAEFVAVQSESALRHVATIHPYDTDDKRTDSLRGSTEEVAEELAKEVSERISLAGLQVVEARISSLAYAPEIAQAMLQRQQAAAVIAAREQIVEGAVSMVQNALERLEKDQIVELDDERKASMVSNLLVVLCSESHTTPVINTGGIYS